MDADWKKELYPSWTVSIAAALMVLAGIIHLVIIPHHWEHAPAHGLFLGLAGAAEVIWAMAFGLKPTERLARIGLVMSLALITLWGITRLYPAPFSHGPEEVDSYGILTKLLEGISALALISLMFIMVPQREMRAAIWRRVGAFILVSVLVGWGVYGIARASEPLFPGLVASEVQEDHPHDSGDQHEHQEPAHTDAPDHDHDPTPIP